MSDLTITVTGAPVVQAKLREFGAVKIPATMRRGVYRGAVVLREAIRAETPVAPKDHTGRYAHKAGNLRRSVRIASARGRPGEITYNVGPMTKEAYYKGWVIRGHDVRHRRGGPVSGRARPNDFVRRGDDRGRGDALRAIEAAWQQSIDEAAR